jgi:hypothetical protein
MKKTASSTSPAVLVRRASLPHSELMEGLEQRCLTDAGPTIGLIQAPTEPVAPGSRLTITFNDVAAPAGAEVTGIKLYRDSNGNGVRDGADEVFGDARQDPSDPSRWQYSDLVKDNTGVGNVTLFAVASDSNSDDGGAIPIGVNLPFRIFYPEGWRNDSTINEYVPMVNPNAFDVQFQVIARYEVGERDSVIASGTIPARSRGGITVSEYAHPGNAVVRLNEGYALEIQSSAFIGATLSHYDSFTGQPSTGAAVGESFTNQTSHEWFFADVSNINADFILFYNPFDQALPLQVTFYDEQQMAHTINWNVDPLRRSGLALSNPDLGLPANSHFGVFITSTGNQEFVASISSYSTTSEIGYTNLGQRLGVTVFPLVEFRDSTDNQLHLFNPSTDDIDVTVEYKYIDSAQAPSQVTYSVAGRTRMNIDLDNLRPNDASAVALRVTGGYVQVTSEDQTRGDSLEATAASTALSVWAFGDGFLDSNTAGTVGFESLGIYNPSASEQQVLVRFLFNDGTFADRHVDVAARSSARLQLDQEPLILNHAQLNFYSIAVYGQSPIIASMIHWDLFQGGGWASLGTPGGTSGPA